MKIIFWFSCKLLSVERKWILTFSCCSHVNIASCNQCAVEAWVRPRLHISTKVSKIGQKSLPVFPRSVCSVEKKPSFGCFCHSFILLRKILKTNVSFCCNTFIWSNWATVWLWISLHITGSSLNLLVVRESYAWS